MQFTIQEFPEMERFFLLELSYFDFQGLDLGNADFLKPIPLSELVAALDQAENSARRIIPEYEHYKEKAIRRLRMIFNESSLLHDMKLVGYINDNAYGTTETHWKSGLVAQAYSDSEGNVFLTYRGSEYLSTMSMLHDFGCRILTYMGIASVQFRRAYQFFRKIAAMTKRNMIVAGNGLGGSLALYTYIKEKETKTGLCLTGTAVNAKKDAFLWKKLNIEKYLLTEDFIFKRNIKKEIQQDIIEHMLQNIEWGHQSEKDSFYREMEACLEQMKTGQMQNYREILEMLMEKLKKYVQADALIVWFRHEDKNGEYIIPYIIRGKVMPGLQHLKLREGETAVCTSAFLGVGKLFPDLKELGMFSFIQPEDGHESMICVPVTCGEKTIGAIHLSKLGEHRKFDEEVYQQILDFAEHLAKYLEPFEREIFYDDDDYFIQIFDRTIQKPVFSIMEFENRTMLFSRKSACEGVIGRLTGQNLGPGEVLKYQGKCYTVENAGNLQEIVQKDTAVLFAKEYGEGDRLSVLMKPYLETEESRIYTEELNNILHFIDFEQQAFATLEVKEKLIFHTLMAMIKRPKFIIAYPYLYPLNERLKEWADSMLRYLAAGQKMTVLKFELES